MDGAAVFNFTIKRVPDLVKDTLVFSETTKQEVDYFIFHQANRFIIKHLVNKLDVPEGKVPLVLAEYGNTGGVSLPLTITQGKLDRLSRKNLNLMLLGYGTGMSWASALINLEAVVPIDHIELPGEAGQAYD
jgi:3-oxoacyl-[acyl-carrier-protein] synthase-3